VRIRREISRIHGREARRQRRNRAAVYDIQSDAMKTLHNPQDKREILSRLEAVRESSSRQWGKMSAHQMICHLCDSFRGVMGEKSLSMAPWFGRGMAKWFALRVPLQWPKGMKTRPEMDQLVAGTPPAAFARDVVELRRLFERF